MKSEIKTVLWVALALVIFGFISWRLALIEVEKPIEEGSWACTADAMECPDGSFVGRVPPYCHFAECPKN